MLTQTEFNQFINKANQAYQQFCVWFNTNNEFAKHQQRWNSLISDGGCKYKNFWGVVVATLQHGWILSTARLPDPAYHPTDKNKKNPRMSLYHVLLKLDDQNFSRKVQGELLSYGQFVNSLKNPRNNFLAHNDPRFKVVPIEAGIENFFEWLENTITDIKTSHPHLAQCKTINLKHTEELSQNGVNEVFENLLKGETIKNDI